MNINILLLRHGKTPGNELKQYIGSTDQPLSESGIKELKAIGSFPKVKKVYVSPLKRAKETAAIFFPNAVQLIRNELREMDFGVFEGRSPEDMADDMQYRKWVDSGCMEPCPNGEKMEDFSLRICNEFEKIVQELIQEKENTAFLVAHGGSLMSIMNKFAVSDKHFSKWYAENGSGWLITIDTCQWKEKAVFSSTEIFDPQKIKYLCK